MSSFSAKPESLPVPTWKHSEVSLWLEQCTKKVSTELGIPNQTWFKLRTGKPGVSNVD